MGLRQRLESLLAGDPTPDREPDPDAPVEIEEVPLVHGPMRVACLQSAGFEAVGVESFDLVTKSRTRMRILVPYRQAEAAAALLAELP